MTTLRQMPAYQLMRDMIVAELLAMDMQPGTEIDLNGFRLSGDLDALARRGWVVLRGLPR